MKLLRKEGVSIWREVLQASEDVGSEDYDFDFDFEESRPLCRDMKTKDTVRRERPRKEAAVYGALIQIVDQENAGVKLLCLIGTEWNIALLLKIMI